MWSGAMFVNTATVGLKNCVNSNWNEFTARIR